MLNDIQGLFSLRLCYISRQELSFVNCMILNLNQFEYMQTTMMKDPCMSVNRVAWSPNGSFFGKFKEIQENSFRNNMQ